MSCVWDAILLALKHHKLVKAKTNIDTLVQYVKAQNTLVNNILWNGESFTDKQVTENYERIKELRHVNNGYLCSSCDPLLILICHIYGINIVHHIMGHIMTYQQRDKSGIQINFESDNEHFWFPTKHNKR